MTEQHKFQYGWFNTTLYSPSILGNTTQLPVMNILHPSHLVLYVVIGNTTTTAKGKVVWTSVHAYNFFFSCWFPACTNAYSPVVSSPPFYLWKGVENIMNVMNSKRDKTVFYHSDISRQKGESSNYYCLVSLKVFGNVTGAKHCLSVYLSIKTKIRQKMGKLSQKICAY